MSLSVSQSEPSFTRPCLGDLGAFNNYRQVFQLVGTFMDHNHFFSTCPRVSKAFKQTMEGEVALRFHWTSPERNRSFTEGKAPFNPDVKGYLRSRKAAIKEELAQIGREMARRGEKLQAMKEEVESVSRALNVQRGNAATK